MLRPVSSVYALKIWPYYVREALGEGPPYDGLMGELAACSSHNEQEATEVAVCSRFVLCMFFFILGRGVLRKSHCIIKVI